MTAETQAPSLVPALFGRPQPWTPGMPTPNLNAALSQLQGKMPRIKKTKEGEIKGETKDGQPYSYTYKYADLGDVVADVGPILAEFGLSFHAAPTFAPGGQHMILECSLRHSSGEYLPSVWPLGPVSIGPQKLGVRDHLRPPVCVQRGDQHRCRGRRRREAGAGRPHGR